MLMMLVVAAVLASVAGGPDLPEQAPTTAPVTVHAPAPSSRQPPAATVEAPSDDTAGGHWASIWPADAYREHIGGRVVLRCEVDRYGIAERCAVASETPQGKGFGEAALQMRTTLKLAPPRGPDGPTDAVMNIAIEFKPPPLNVDFGSDRGGGPTEGSMAAAAPQLTAFGNPLPEKRSITMLDNPVWASAPSRADVASVFPARAGAIEGYAVAHCRVGVQGYLSGCQIIKAAPEDRGFGEAALALASRFRVAPQWSVAPHRDELWVDVPIRFSAGGEADDRMIRNPYWVAGFDPEQALKLFPPEAAAKGLVTGRGVAECRVAAGGALGGCEPLESDPPGLGFDLAAAKLASTMRLNPWTSDGAPVDGAKALVNIRLNLKSGA